MMEAKRYIVEGTRENFTKLVLENSRKGPVLVNFWADWAGPCHRLFPILTSLTEEYGGRFLLVNINTDAQKPVAQEYAVTSLPLVKVFRGGKVVEDIHGYQPEPELRRLINRYVARASDRRIAEAVQLYRRGEVEQGLSMLAQAALDDPDNLRIPVILAKMLMARERFEEAENLLNGLPEETRRQPEIAHLIAHMGFIQVARAAPDRSTLEARLAADPGDAQARYELSALDLVADDYDSALGHLLELVRHDRAFGDDAGRNGMLAIFRILGNHGELVERYRSQMFRALH